MTTQEILERAQVSGELKVLNTPFVINDKTTITLEGGDEMYWIFSEDDRLLSVNPSTDEVLALTPLEEEIEGDDEALIHHGKEYEFSYTDQGKVTGSEDGSDFDEETKISFKDFEAEDGEIIRAVNSTHTEDPFSYIGQATLEDDIL